MNETGTTHRRDTGTYTRLADGTYGRVTADADCGCCCPTGPCEHCADGTMPLFYSLLPDDLAYSDNNGVCIAIPGDNSIKYVLDSTPDLNIPLCLGPGPGDCIRHADDVRLTGSTDNFLSVDCDVAGTFGTVGFTALEWYLTKLLDKWELLAFVVTLAGFPRLVAFFGEIAVTDPSPCMVELTFTNQLTNTTAIQPVSVFGFGGQDAIAVAYGGTATVVACACSEVGI
jgi:hypothetical protein